MRISCLVFTRTSGTSDCFRNTIQYNIYIYIYMYIYIYPHDIHIWLVLWNLTFVIFHSVGNVIIPSDGFSYFFSLGSTTWDRHDMSWNGVTTVSQSTVEGGFNQPYNPGRGLLLHVLNGRFNQRTLRDYEAFIKMT